MAEFELIMILPIIIGFFCVMMWVGLAMDTLSHTVVQSRHDSWSQRGTGGSGSLDYSQDNLTSRSVSNPVTFMPWSNSLPPAKASQTVMTGAWDYREINLNSQPNFKAFDKLLSHTDSAVVSSWHSTAENLADARNELQQRISEAENEWNNVKSQTFDLPGDINAAKASITNAIQSLINVNIKSVSDLITDAPKDADVSKWKKKLGKLQDLFDESGDAIDALGKLGSAP